MFPFLHIMTIRLCFQIAPRAQNAVAHVNAGFKLKVNKQDGFRLVEKPSIVYGGVHPRFVSASKTISLFLTVKH